MEIENVVEIEVEAEEGKQGLSAYEVYLNNGGTLSEEEWLLSLKGETGQNGVDGKDGANGKDGVDGITPTIGANGNWFIGDTDTGMPSRGEQGEEGKGGGITEITEGPVKINDLESGVYKLVGGLNLQFVNGGSFSTGVDTCILTVFQDGTTKYAYYLDNYKRLTIVYANTYVTYNFSQMATTSYVDDLIGDINTVLATLTEVSE